MTWVIPSPGVSQSSWLGAVADHLTHELHAAASDPLSCASGAVHRLTALPPSAHVGSADWPTQPALSHLSLSTAWSAARLSPQHDAAPS